jgi:asparagine synthase (glutamine-hydrolysing)
MSGIAGILRFDGAPVEPGLIEKMTSAMAYRGPDGIHHWVKGSVALGHCMLRTTPESLEEHQPLTNGDQTLVLVMDGRLDNRDELLKAFRAHDVLLRGQSDADYLLAAYRLWGEDCPTHLLGDFAFAVWDVRRQRLFCARDHFGVKPYYYFRDDKLFAFASEEEVFFGLPGVTGRPNEDRIAYFLVPAFEAFDFNVSWLQDILKLPPGNALTVQADGRQATSTYWQLQPMDELRLGSDGEYREAFRSVFTQAVRCRMRTPTDPALMLSGGMDSASVAAVAREIAQEQPGQALHTFSVVSDEPAMCEETRNILAIVRGHEEQAHLASVGGLDGMVSDQDLMDACWSRAHPVDNSIILPAVMYKLAGRAGFRVMFDGIDGDLATYTPLHYQASLLRSGAWGEAWREAHLARVNNTYQKHLSLPEIVARSVWNAYAPYWMSGLRSRLKRPARNGGFGASNIHPDFARRIRLAERLEEKQSGALALGRQTDQETHIHALTQPGITRGVEGYDRVAARYGIEPRHPWADKRLVEFHLRLPMGQKARQGWTKYLVRSAIASALDPEVCWHSGKGHLGWQLTRRMMMGSDDTLSAILAGEASSLDRYVHPRWLRSKPFSPGAGQGDDDLSRRFDGGTLALWLGRIG